MRKKERERKAGEETKGGEMKEEMQPGKILHHIFVFIEELQKETERETRTFSLRQGSKNTIVRTLCLVDW